MIESRGNSGWGSTMASAKRSTGTVVNGVFSFSHEIIAIITKGMTNFATLPNNTGLFEKYIDSAKLHDKHEFNELALKIFAYQAQNNLVYAQYLQLLGVDYKLVNHITRIPFLPVRFFKSHAIKSSQFDAEAVFESSNTGQGGSSKHHVKETEWYDFLAQYCFQFYFDHPANYCHLALLPSYLERQSSSLVHMINRFCSLSKFKQSGTYLNEHQQLYDNLLFNKNNQIPTILWGVTFGLLDFIDAYNLSFDGLHIIETGGMKGRRKEITRHELYEKLSQALPGCIIHSEYGMTEMLSQCYSMVRGLFTAPPHVRMLVRDTNDPLSCYVYGKHKGLNVIDLGNFDTCSFIALEDLGTVHQDGSFEVLGRFDFADVRGCNLMIKS